MNLDLILIMNKQYFKTDGQQIYYELHGNASSTYPILFLHGGPGLGCSEKDLRFFDLTTQYVLLVDQRGSGKSLPSGVTTQNTTQGIIKDLHALIDFLGFKKVVLFGGSWGSTLACIFAIKHPERVQAMILRGFFPANRTCVNFFEKGGTKLFFPDAWEHYIRLVPKDKQSNPTVYYYEMLHSEDKKLQYKYAYESIRYALVMIALEEANDTELVIDEMLLQKARIQNYYSLHQFFIPDDYIFDEAVRIKHIPTRIIHGRYDMICPPIFAYQLHQLLENSTLQFVQAGHLSSEPAIEFALKQAVLQLGKLD